MRCFDAFDEAFEANFCSNWSRFSGELLEIDSWSVSFVLLAVVAFLKLADALGFLVYLGFLGFKTNLLAGFAVSRGFEGIGAAIMLSTKKLMVFESNRGFEAVFLVDPSGARCG